MNQKTIVTILAVIGGLVVAGWLLKIAFHLFVPIVIVGACVIGYMVWQDKKRIK